MQIAYKSIYKLPLKAIGLVLVLLCSLPTCALTPSEAFQKGKAKLSGAKTVTASFSMTTGGNKIIGKLLSKGKKFAISTNTSSSWYNGSDLYTYIPSKSETIVFKPTSSELIETNPLLYLSSSGNYNISATKTKKAGLETVVLIPKSSGSGVRSVTIDLDSKTFLPRSIKILPSSGSVINLTITKLTLNSNIKDSSFTYPRNSYSKVRIIDMR